MAVVRFVAHGRSWEVDVPAGTTILQASKVARAPEGDACGGVCACSTCHVYVVRGGAQLSEPEELEEDVLDKAFDVRTTSRLGCQAVIRDVAADVEVEISRESLDAYYTEHPGVVDPRKG